ncbi:hypothetical protein [Miltoncostaea marina]|uniref:hypothetical protein n=1 Tax=Miltoncostaea marina TaxID=2843215 RepID=UPI001C3D9E49|nr:hypothetical protein [Miltoncostaea marina]
MPLRNRVTPFNEIVAVADRGLFMGNRGRLHEDRREPVRRYRVRQWITCRTEFKDRRRELMTPGEYTELFFLDEATALAAGHRPCGECRREAFTRFRAAWSRGNADGEPVALRDLDARLHAERWEGWGNYGHPRRHRAMLDELPDGAMVAIDGEALLVLGEHLHRWTPGGYASDPRPRRPAGEVELLTPPSTVAAIAAGYAPVIHPSARAA